MCKYKIIAKFIWLAFVEEVDGECVKSEKASASLMNHWKRKWQVVRFLLKLQTSQNQKKIEVGKLEVNKTPLNDQR